MTYAAGLDATAQIILLDNDVPPVPASLSDAARFLTQATFGPTLPEIDRVQSMGYEAWLAEQFAAPPSSFVGFLDGITGETVDEPHLQEAWMTHAMVGPDQLPGSASPTRCSQSWSCLTTTASRARRTHWPPTWTC